MMICACCVENVDPEEGIGWRLFGTHGKPNILKKLVKLVVIHIPSMTKIHCSSLRSLKSYEDEVEILILVDILKKGETAAVVNDTGLCITGSMTSCQGEKKLRKTNKVKTKKIIVAKTG